MHECHGQKVFHILGGQLGGFADAERPQGEDVKQAEGELDEADGPGEGEDVQGLLVVDVVANVKQIPQEKEGANLKRGGGGLGGSGGGTAAGADQGFWGDDGGGLKVVDGSGLDGGGGGWEAGGVAGAEGEGAGGGGEGGGGFGEAGADCVLIAEGGMGRDERLSMIGGGEEGVLGQ